jgi:hypothetical protein
MTVTRHSLDPLHRGDDPTKIHIKRGMGLVLHEVEKAPQQGTYQHMEVQCLGKLLGVDEARGGQESKGDGVDRSIRNGTIPVLAAIDSHAQESETLRPLDLVLGVRRAPIAANHHRPGPRRLGSRRLDLLDQLLPRRHAALQRAVGTTGHLLRALHLSQQGFDLSLDLCIAGVLCDLLSTLPHSLQALFNPLHRLSRLLRFGNGAIDPGEASDIGLREAGALQDTVDALRPQQQEHQEEHEDHLAQSGEQFLAEGDDL